MSLRELLERGVVPRGGLPTGVVDLDAVTDGGIGPGTLWVIVGPHGSGRSMFALQIAILAAARGVETMMITLRDDPIEVARRITRWPLRSGQDLADVPLHLRSADDVPHGWMIGYPVHEPDGLRIGVFVVDDIDVYAHHDGRAPGGHDLHLSQPSALPEHLRTRARLTGVPIVVTLPTRLVRDRSGSEIPEPWQRAADVIVRVDRPVTARPTEDTDAPSDAWIAVLRNHFGPQVSLSVSVHGWGGLYSVASPDVP